LRNSEYAILKWFADAEGVSGAPGLDLPGLDTAAIATGYGMSSRRVDGAQELREALGAAIASPRPELVEVGVAPGMWLF
ncbi:MAG: thiamine pyrophosphate-dependent enzyme, partial [Solirubrobacterales bacterium]